MRRLALSEYLDSRCEPEPMSGCWVWVGYVDPEGYGTVSPTYRHDTPSRSLRAHKVSYECFRGAVPAGMELDHLCRTRSCINPKHLEPVSNYENQCRGVGTWSSRRGWSHCIHGHEFTETNTYIKPNGTRSCRTCKIASKARQKVMA